MKASIAPSRRPPPPRERRPREGFDVAPGGDDPELHPPREGHGQTVPHAHSRLDGVPRPSLDERAGDRPRPSDAWAPYRSAAQRSVYARPRKRCAAARPIPTGWGRSSLRTALERWPGARPPPGYAGEGGPWLYSSARSSRREQAYRVPEGAEPLWIHERGPGAKQSLSETARRRTPTFCRRADRPPRREPSSE